jgi:hypothetical protein
MHGERYSSSWSESQLPDFIRCKLAEAFGASVSSIHPDDLEYRHGNAQSRRICLIVCGKTHEPAKPTTKR